MLSRARRLNKQNDFDNIFQQGGSAQDDFLVVRFLPNHLPLSRFGLVASTKVSKKAVDRNRLRRQLSESIRLNLKRITPGWDLVIIVKPKMIGLDYGQIEKSLLGLLRKKKLYV